jgi:hypothetical protein
MATYEQLVAAARKADQSGDQAGAKRLLEMAVSQRGKAAPETTLQAQTMSGVNEGIGNMLGMPVDLMTGGINAVTGGVNKLTGANIPPITDPVGGSGTFNKGMTAMGSIDQTPPQTDAQRYARTTGEAFGSSVVPAAGMAGKVQKLGKYIATELASALGSGVATQAARDVAPGNQLAETAAALLGGGAPIAMAGRDVPHVPTTEELQASSRAGYENVAAGSPLVHRDAVDRLAASTDDLMTARRVDPRRDAVAGNISDIIKGEVGTYPDLHRMEQTRRLVGDEWRTGLTKNQEALVGQGKKEITDFLESLEPKDVVGDFDDFQGKLNTLNRSRSEAARAYKSQELEGKIEQGELNAATSGTGGNEVNAVRQRIKSILVNDNAKRRYTPEERAMMEEIVRGTPTTNILRMVGRFSPTSGMLPAAMSTGAVAGLGATGAIPAVLGMAGKTGAEMLTQKQVKALAERVRNGKEVPSAIMSGVQRRILGALLAAETASAGSSESQSQTQ